VREKRGTVNVETQIAPQDLHATIALLQDELEATNHEVMMLTLELEDRVAERTAQLAESNAELIAEVTERTRAAAEIKQLNRDLNVRAAELEEANRDLEAFSYSVSHDLRAPLSQMMGFAAVLEEEAGATLSEKSRRYVGKIVAAGRRMADLIDNLLRFSRDAHRGLELRSVKLNELVEGVICECKQNLGSRKVVWRVAQLPEAWCDAALMRQVFVNLISNALKYSGPRDPAIVEICPAELHEEEAVYSIRDNGVGFDSQYADKLFGAFQRLHNSSEFEGSGIGLASVRRIISRHGGRVWAQGKVGEGASFYFSLPLKRGAK
jgi:light-regulated signal transduction histidine kinase (bacteriophytochrome)